ncbi:MAG: AsmA-like C-terminal region-containing protein [Candidatus Omnitrophica bacterium]|nr:AsmA-like C-terminal region-containing protein [Candidatus Omnitrophota bacterium]
MKKFVPIAVVVLILFAILFLFVVPQVFRQLGVQGKIQSYAEARLHQPISFDSIYLSVFPRVAVVLTNVKVGKTWPAGSVPVFEATRLSIQPRLLALIFRQMEVNSICVKKGKLRIPISSLNEAGQSSLFVLNDIELELRGIRTKHPFKVLVSAKTEDGGRIKGNGKITIDFKQIDLEHAGFKFDLDFKEVSLKTLGAWLPRSWVLEFPQGKCDWKTHIECEPGAPEISATGNGDISNFTFVLNKDYAKQSKPSEFGIRYDIALDRAKREVVCRSAEITSSLGKAQVTGRFGFSEMNDAINLHVQLGGLNLDSLPQLILPVQQAVPYNLGFSGACSGDVFLKGQMRNFNISGELDFLNTLLTYSKFFTKPKELPFKLNFNLSVSEKRFVRGDFDVKLLSMVLKGSLADFDLERGDVALTFITNKFNLSGWQNTIEPFKYCDLSGVVKLFLTMKGNTKSGSPPSLTGNLTFDGVTARAKKGLVLRDLGATVDFENNGFVVRDARMDIDGSAVTFAMSYRDFKNPAVILNLNIRSVNPYDFLVSLCNTVEQYGEAGDAIMSKLEPARNITGALFKGTEPLKDITLDLSSKDNVVKVNSLSLTVFGGKVNAIGNVDLSGAAPSFYFDSSGSNVSLGSLALLRHDSGEYISGLLSFQNNIRGRGLSKDELAANLEGTADVSVRNIKFHTFDLMGGLSKMSGFLGLDSCATGSTEASDLSAHFLIRDAKVSTNNLALVSPLFSASADGYTDFDGALNYRIELTLSEETQRRTGISSKLTRGPIPVQLYGNYRNPNVSFDVGKVVEHELDDLIEKGMNKLFGKKKK